MLKNGDTLTSLPWRGNLLLRLTRVLALCAFLVASFAASRPIFALEDPFSVPIKSLNKISPDNVVQFRLVELTTNDKKATATIELDTRAGFKVYEKGLKVEYRSAATLNTPVPVSFNPEKPAKVVQDPFYNEPRGVFEKGSRFLVASDFPLDETGFVRIRFEACSVNTCLLPAYFLIAARKGEVSRAEPRDTAAPLSGSSGSTPSNGPSNFSGSSASTTTASSTRADAPLAPVTSAQTTPTVSATPAAVATASPASPLQNDEISLVDTVTARVQKALTERSWILFPLLFLAGLLMNLTPCVYPMIPITLNVLSHTAYQDDKDIRDHPHPIVPAFIYVGGIIVAYAGMGVVAGMTGSLFGGLLQSKLFTFGLACLMFALGLSMLGVIDLSRVQNFGSRIPLSKHSPRFAVFTMGAVSGLVAAPCTGPVLSLLLVLVGQTKDPVYGFTLMSVFAAGFGAPYLFLSLLSHHFKKLPKAGSLMIAVKNIFAALMFALSLYYLKPLLGQVPIVAIVYGEPGLAGVIAMTLVSVLFLFWQFRSSQHPMAVLGTQIGLSLLALWLTLASIKGFIPISTPVWPSVNRIGDPVTIPQNGSTTATKINWYKDWRKAVQAATVEKKGLLVDAWAEWCVACLKMDAEVWSEPGVEALVEQHFIAVKIDFTESNPASEDLAKRWDLSGLPAVGVYPVGANFDGPPPILFREAVTVSQFHQAVQKMFNGDIPR